MYSIQLLMQKFVEIFFHIFNNLMNIQGQETANITCAAMHKRSERIALTILDRIEIKSSDHIALLYPPCVDLVSAFYACLYIGKERKRKTKTNK